MTVFSSGLKPDMTSGLLNLNSVKQMLFCIAQNESSARELDAYAMLGISNILEDAGSEIEQDWNEISSVRLGFCLLSNFLIFDNIVSV